MSKYTDDAVLEKPFYGGIAHSETYDLLHIHLCLSDLPVTEYALVKFKHIEVSLELDGIEVELFSNVNTTSLAKNNELEMTFSKGDELTETTGTETSSELSPGSSKIAAKATDSIGTKASTGTTASGKFDDLGKSFIKKCPRNPIYRLSQNSQEYIRFDPEEPTLKVKTRRVESANEVSISGTLKSGTSGFTIAYDYSHLDLSDSLKILNPFREVLIKSAVREVIESGVQMELMTNYAQ